jgi:ankyrin repeat protein
MISAKYNKYENTKIIIDYKVNLNLQNDDNNTALMIAVRYKNNANLDLQNNDGFTATMMAVIYSNSLIKNMVIHHPNLDLQDNKGLTAVMYASMMGLYNIIENLIDYNCDLELKNKR